MRFNIISHACFEAEAHRKVVVVDPWIVGSVYWDSWWHYPPPLLTEKTLRADFIYLTHWHFDHFHAPSLQRFNRSAHILMPKFPVSMMMDQLRTIGFDQVTELEHGVPFDLAPGFTLTSYQIQYQDDSIAVIEADGVTLMDLNDAKPLPLTWQQLRKKHPTVDFMLRSHSPAWSYPSCYEFEEPSEVIPIDSTSYTRSFVKAAEIVQPRFAIPFASGVCHLHRDTLNRNRDLVTTDELSAYFNHHQPRRGELVVMPPGSSWSSEKGFELTPEPQELSIYVEEAAILVQDSLSARYAMEDEATLDTVAFVAFFEQFFHATRLIRIFLNVVWVFVIRGGAQGDEQCWVLDFRKQQLRRVEAEPTEFTARITVNPSVLNEAIRDRIFTNIDIAKRWRVYVRRGGLTPHLIMTVLISLFEAGYFEARDLFRWRTAAGIVRRWREAIDYVRLATSMVTRRGEAMAERVTDPYVQ